MCRKTVFVEHNVMGHNVIRLLFFHLVLVNLYKHKNVYEDEYNSDIRTDA